MDTTPPQEQTFATALKTTKSYLFGSQRVAMRVLTDNSDAIYSLHGDHLGSVSMSTDTSGNIISQARYTPFGEALEWVGSGTSPTDFGFTSQRAERGMGLLDYNARFYLPSLGRFISADSIVPGAGQVMAWDRFSYTQNNPLKYTDPSGRTIDCTVGDYACNKQLQNERYIAATVQIEVQNLEAIPPIGSRGLGTKISSHTILTHHHDEDGIGKSFETADKHIIKDASGNPISMLPDGIDEGVLYTIKDDENDLNLISLPNSMGASSIPVATPELMELLSPGDLVTIVYKNDNTDQLETIDLPLIKIKNGIAIFDNPGDLFNSGDSGGGAFYKGSVIGNSHAVLNGQLWVTLNPSWVSNGSWKSETPYE